MNYKYGFFLLLATVSAFASINKIELKGGGPSIKLEAGSETEVSCVNSTASTETPVCIVKMTRICRSDQYSVVFYKTGDTVDDMCWESDEKASRKLNDYRRSGLCK